MTEKEVLDTLNSAGKLKFGDMKISYMLLKPNAEKHYEEILSEVRKNQFIVIDQYAIFDYETVNMALHKEQKDTIRYIIPISRFYYDFYGNYGVLLLIGKKDITYENFCLQVLRMKKYLRAKFELKYVSYAFDTSELGEKNQQQRLLIKAKNGEEVKKDAMNGEGTFMVFSMNSLHSPDEDVSSVVKELKLLIEMKILSKENIIPKAIIKNMGRYGTFEFLKDI